MVVGWHFIATTQSLVFTYFYLCVLHKLYAKVANWKVVIRPETSLEGSQLTFSNLRKSEQFPTSSTQTKSLKFITDGFSSKMEMKNFTSVNKK